MSEERGHCRGCCGHTRPDMFPLVSDPTPAPCPGLARSPEVAQRVYDSTTHSVSDMKPGQYAMAPINLMLELRAVLAALDRDARTAECVWSQDDEDSYCWGTSCGHAFALNDGTPEDNHIRFCCYCGKPVRQELWTEKSRAA